MGGDAELSETVLFLEELKWYSIKVLLVFPETSCIQDMVPEREIRYCEKCTPRLYYGIEFIQEPFGACVCTHVCVQALGTLYVHTHALCLLDIITHVNSALNNIEVGNYELLFINEV